jgi:hypothetical protein
MHFMNLACESHAGTTIYISLDERHPLQRPRLITSAKRRHLYTGFMLQRRRTGHDMAKAKVAVASTSTHLTLPPHELSSKAGGSWTVPGLVGHSYPPPLPPTIHHLAGGAQQEYLPL